MSDLTPREQILHEAARTIAGDRNKSYGSPQDSFDSIARLWGLYLNSRDLTSRELDASDVALMMTLVKVSRLMTGKPDHRDSWLDIAGYAACGYEVSQAYNGE